MALGSSGTEGAETPQPLERPRLAPVPLEFHFGHLSSTAGEMEISAWGGGGDGFSNESFLLLSNDSLRASPRVEALTGGRRDQDPRQRKCGTGKG